MQLLAYLMALDAKLNGAFDTVTYSCGLVHWSTKLISPLKSLHNNARDRSTKCCQCLCPNRLAILSAVQLGEKIIKKFNYRLPLLNSGISGSFVW